MLLKNFNLTEVYFNDKVYKNLSLSKDLRSKLSLLKFEKVSSSGCLINNRVLLFYDVEVSDWYVAVGFLYEYKYYYYHVSADNYSEYILEFKGCLYKYFTSSNYQFVGFNNLRYDDWVIDYLCRSKPPVEFEVFISNVNSFSNNLISNRRGKFVFSKQKKFFIYDHVYDLFSFSGWRVGLKALAARLNLVSSCKFSYNSVNLDEVLMYNCLDLVYTLVLYRLLESRLIIESEIRVVKNSFHLSFPQSNLAYLMSKINCSVFAWSGLRSAFSLKLLFNKVFSYCGVNSKILRFLDEVKDLKFEVVSGNGVKKKVWECDCYSKRIPFRRVLDFGYIKLSFGLGGINTVLSSGRFFKEINLTNAGFVIIDVKSYYPNLLKLITYHNVIPMSDLNKTFMNVYFDMLASRLEESDYIKKTSLKLSLNSFTGMLGHGESYNRFYHGEFHASMTILGQVLMSLFFDRLHESSWHCVLSCSTDGLIVQSNNIKDLEVVSRAFWKVYDFDISFDVFNVLLFKDSKNYLISNSSTGVCKGVGSYRRPVDVWNIYNITKLPRPSFYFNALHDYIYTKRFVLKKNIECYLTLLYDKRGWSYTGKKYDAECVDMGSVLWCCEGVVFNGHLRKSTSHRDNTIKNLLFYGDDPKDINFVHYENVIYNEIKRFSIINENRVFFFAREVRDFNKFAVLSKFKYEYPNADFIQYFIPGSGDKKYKRGVSTSSILTNMKKWDNATLIGVITGKVSMIICVDVDFPDLFKNERVFFSSIKEYIGKTLCVYRVSNDDAIKKVSKTEDLISRRFKMFFKVTDDRFLKYSVRNKLSTLGFEILWGKVAPFIYGELATLGKYMIYNDIVDLCVLEPYVVAWLVKKEVLVKKHIKVSVTDRVDWSIYNNWYNDKLKFVIQFLDKNSYDYRDVDNNGFIKVVCPGWHKHTDKSTRYTLSISYKRYLYINCFHKSCNKEFELFKRGLTDYVYKHIPKVTEVNTPSQISIWDSETGAGKTFQTTLLFYNNIKNNEPTIYTTLSYSNIVQVFEYMETHRLNDKETPLKKEDLHKSISLLIMGRPLKNESKFILTYHCYLTNKGSTSEYFKLLRLIFNGTSKGKKYHVFIDEAQSFIQTSLINTFDITRVYKKQTKDRETENLKIHCPNVGVSKIILDDFKYDKCEYERKYITEGGIYQYHPIHISKWNCKQGETIEVFDTIDNRIIDMNKKHKTPPKKKNPIYKYTIKKMNTIYFFLTYNKKFDDIIKYEDIWNKEVTSSIDEYINHNLKWSSSSIITETQPYSIKNDKLITWEDLQDPNIFEGDTIRELPTAPYVRKLMTFNVLPLLILQQRTTSCTFISATLTEEERVFLKNIWKNNTKNDTCEHRHTKVEYKHGIKKIIYIILDRQVPITNAVTITQKYNEFFLKFYNAKTTSTNIFNRYKNTLINRKQLEYLTLYTEDSYKHTITQHRDRLGINPQTIITYYRCNISTGINLGDINIMSLDMSGILPTTLVPNSDIRGTTPDELEKIICHNLASQQKAAIVQAQGRIMRAGGWHEKIVILEKTNNFDECSKLTEQLQINNVSTEIYKYQINKWTHNEITNLITYHIQNKQIDNPTHYKCENFKREDNKGNSEYSENPRIKRLVRKLIDLKEDNQILTKSGINTQRYKDIQEDVFKLLPPEVLEIVTTKIKRYNKKTL